ncbi:MAG TPA: hypothetical protein PK156_23920 [Polyangium sp.]|nr:hypothetical protein [Polyangium sp.]
MPIPPDLEQQIRRSSAIGVQLYLLDKVSAIGTDVMLANIPNPQARGLRGYLPMRAGDDQGNPSDSFLVLFFTNETPPRIACETRITPNRKPEFKEFDPPRVPDELVAALFSARQIAMAAWPNTGQPLNPVLLPGAALGEDGILVYLLVGTNKPNVAVFGQHFRALVPMNGTKVSYMMPMSKSILELPTRAPDGEAIEALTVTHIVTDYPLETHVFISLQMKMPIYVVTNRGLWYVNGDEISFLGNNPPGE